MKIRFLFLLLAVVAITTLAIGQKRSVLFDGKNLDAWQAAENWTVEDGVIALKNSTDGHEHNDNYLYTKEQYGNFVLDLDFRMAPNTNSGVYLRTSDTNDPVQTGIEIQVGLAHPTPRLVKNSIGAIYGLTAPTSNPAKPDDWNHYRITCKGGSIKVELNGVAVSEVDLDQFTELGKNPDGSKNKFSRPMKDFARKGFIGLQDHGSPVWYRNIRIESLD